MEYVILTVDESWYMPTIENFSFDNFEEVKEKFNQIILDQLDTIEEFIEKRFEEVEREIREKINSFKNLEDYQWLNEDPIFDIDDEIELGFGYDITSKTVYIKNLETPFSAYLFIKK